MDFVFMKNYVGDYIAIPIDEDQVQLCPVCGTSLGGCEAYYADKDPSSEICPGCNVQFGDDDSSGRSDSKYIDEYFQLLRKEWLDRIGWLDWQVGQLRDVLGITVDRENKSVPLIRVADLMKTDRSDSSQTE